MSTKKRTVEIRDITGEVGPLFGPVNQEPSIPMYSYERPAYNFWQGFYAGLIKRGLTHEQAAEELRSKGPRWLFDMRGDEVQALGEAMAATYALCVTKEPKKKGAR